MTSHHRPNHLVEFQCHLYFDLLERPPLIFHIKSRYMDMHRRYIPATEITLIVETEAIPRLTISDVVCLGRHETDKEWLHGPLYPRIVV